MTAKKPVLNAMKKTQNILVRNRMHDNMKKFQSKAEDKNIKSTKKHKGILNNSK